MPHTCVNYLGQIGTGFQIPAGWSGTPRLKVMGQCATRFTFKAMLTKDIVDE